MLKPGSYTLGAYLICASSSRPNCASTRPKKSAQFFLAFGVQAFAATAKARGQVIYSRWRVLYTCAVQRLACVPMISLESTLSGTGLYEYTLLRRSIEYTRGSMAGSPFM